MKVEDRHIVEARRLTQATWKEYKGGHQGCAYSEFAHAQTLAKLELAEKALKHYYEVFCEAGVDDAEYCGKLTVLDCSGCKAREALNQIKGRNP